jgi:hypothetical protein
VRTGEEAPDFELESTEGHRVCLSALRGCPVLPRNALHFSSFTLTIAADMVAPIKQLHEWYATG